jgi:hypothetical protein
VLPQEIRQRAVHLVGMSQAGGVSSARYHDQVRGPGQAIAEHLPQRQRDRPISLAMHNQGRLSDLAEAGRDVVGTHEHGHRVGSQPVLVDLGLAEQHAEQDRGHRIGTAVTEAVRMPLIWVSLSGGQATAALSIRTRALTRSGARRAARSDRKPPWE